MKNEGIDLANFAVKALRVGITDGNSLPDIETLKDALRAVLTEASNVEPGIIFMAFIALAIVASADTRLWNAIVEDVKWQGIIENLTRSTE